MHAFKSVRIGHSRILICAAALVLLVMVMAPLGALAVGEAGTAEATGVEPVQNPRINMLTHPVFGYPEVQARGEDFTLTFDTTNWGELGASTAVGWEAVLISSNDPVPLLIDLWVVDWDQVDEGIYEVTVTIPSDAAVDLYDLQVICKTDGECGNLVDSQPHAVKVVDGFDNDLTFINLTDTQTGDILSVFNNLPESTPNWWPFASPENYWKHLRKAVDQINLIHPDMVIMSGDIVYGQLYFGEYPLEYPITHDILQDLDVPVFIGPGNHDNYIQDKCDGEMYFQRYFAPLRYSFDFGPYHFTAADTYDWPAMDRAGYCLIVSTWGGQITEEQLQWLEDDLEAKQDSLMRIVYCHHSPNAPSDWGDAWWTIHNDAEYPYPQLYLRLFFGLLGDQKWVGEGRQEMLDVLEAQKVDLLLAGHVHYDYVKEDINAYGTDEVVTTAGCFDLTAGEAYPGYRMIEISDGDVMRMSYKEDYSIPIYINGYPPAANLKQQTEPAVAYSFAKPNDGSSTTNTLSVNNGLDMEIPVYVEFVLPAGAYNVINGTVVQTSMRGGSVVLYVSSSVAAEGTLDISVSPL
jgi:3',5'-cyclic AMP phosphodiesterase CpdA